MLAGNARGAVCQGTSAISDVLLVLPVVIQRCVSEGSWTMTQLSDVYTYIGLKGHVRTCC